MPERRPDRALDLDELVFVQLVRQLVVNRVYLSVGKEFISHLLDLLTDLLELGVTLGNTLPGAKVKNGKALLVVVTRALLGGEQHTNLVALFFFDLLLY